MTYHYIDTKQTTNQAYDEPHLPIYVALFLFFSAITVFAIFETDLTLLSKRDFGWGAEVYFFIISFVLLILTYPLDK